MKLTILTPFLLFCLCGYAQTAAPAAPAQRYYVLLYTTGPGWDAAKAPQAQTNFGAHSRHLARLRAEKKLALGARYSDTGMLIIRAADEAEVKAIIAADSSVASQTFKVAYYAAGFFQKGCID